MAKLFTVYFPLVLACSDRDGAIYLAYFTHYTSLLSLNSTLDTTALEKVSHRPNVSRMEEQVQSDNESESCLGLALCLYSISNLKEAADEKPNTLSSANIMIQFNKYLLASSVATLVKLAACLEAHIPWHSLSWMWGWRGGAIQAGIPVIRLQSRLHSSPWR